MRKSVDASIWLTQNVVASIVERRWGLAIQQSCLSGLFGPGEISFTFHPVRIRYPSEMNQIRFTGQAG